MTIQKHQYGYSPPGSGHIFKTRLEAEHFARREKYRAWTLPLPATTERSLQMAEQWLGTDYDLDPEDEEEYYTPQDLEELWEQFRRDQEELRRELEQERAHPVTTDDQEIPF